MDATTSMKFVRDRVALLAIAALITALPAKAQEPLLSRSPGENTSHQSPQSYDVLHVNAATGSDQQGIGSAEQPYKTITQALRLAPATSTVILLAPGHYSRDSGEQFPLRLRAGLTIQGNAGEARNTIIAGGGEFQTGDTTQHATILTTDRSGLANVAVSNSKGSGVWITTGSPILRRVALVSNAIAGVQVTDGAPVIENSYFTGNQYGLSIQGNGRAIIRGNFFEATGRAITIASPATPIINNNRIARNDVGIALKNNARPLLEANVLDDNSRNGVVEVESAEVAAAPTATPLSDTLAVQVSEISRESTVRDIEAQEQTAVFRRSDADTDNITREEAHIEPAASPEDREQADDGDSANENLASRQQQITQPAAPSPVTAQEQPAVFQSNQTSPELGNVALSTDEERSTDEFIPIDVIPANQPEIDPSNSSRREGVAKLLARLNRSSDAAASPTAATADNAETTPIPEIPVAAVSSSDERLPVPSVAIPSGGASRNLTPPGTVALATSFRYRVLVDMADADELQDLVPDAFRTEVDNRMFMQAGAYVDETEAKEQLEWLEENGIDGRISVRN
ncbi:MAG: DUF1565 domain-containing protein [Leptolyngbyaceae cyanobacterium]